MLHHNSTQHRASAATIGTGARVSYRLNHKNTARGTHGSSSDGVLTHAQRWRSETYLKLPLGREARRIYIVGQSKPAALPRSI